MKFAEALTACVGCKFALATPKEALPQAEPDLEQPSGILCRAAVYPKILQGPWPQFDNKVRVMVGYFSTTLECIMSPSPQEANCSSAVAVKRTVPNSYIDIDSKAWEAGEYNFDPLKGQTEFERQGKLK